MSVEATSWALNQQAVTDPAARSVLFGLANHANHEGRHAFPSVNLICRYTGLSPRTVKAKLKLLLELGLIRRGNQGVAAAIIERSDRRPIVYDLDLSKGLQTEPIGDEERDAANAPRSAKRGAGETPRKPNGVQMTTERGARAAPEPSLTVLDSLSDATEPGSAARAASVFEQAATAADDGDPAGADAAVPRKTAMTLDWQPEPESYRVACYQRGLVPDANVHDALIDFREHFTDQPHRINTHAAWTRRFVRWVAENAKRQQATAAPQTTGGKSHADRRRSTPKRRLTAQEARAAAEGRAAAGTGNTLEGEWTHGHG